MIYGKGNTFNVERMLELFQAFETFVDVRDSEPVGLMAPPAPPGNDSHTYTFIHYMSV